MAELDDLLRALYDRDGSDLHLHAGQPPLLRIHGTLTRSEFAPLSSEDITRLTSVIIGEAFNERFVEQREVETSYATEFSRFRVNLFRQQGQVGAVFRLVPLAIRPLNDLMLPPVARDLCLRPHGLLLVTGPVGSGKSTTLASLVDYINLHKRVHIVTIEDPIEFVHPDHMASIDQREIGRDAHSPAAALRHAVRQNADVIVLGELNEPEMIKAAIKAAETGHLIIGSLSTPDAAHTVERLIDTQPMEEQRRVRTQLAGCLVGTISQTLLTRMDAPARIAAFEIMVASPAIRNLIREAKTWQIPAEIETGGKYGMISLDQALAALVRRRIARYEDALARSANPREFEQRLGLNPIMP